MTNHFIATTYTQEDGQSDYTLHVYINTRFKDSVSLQSVDQHGGHAITRFSPDRARDIAQQLTAAAEHIDSLVLEVGATVTTEASLDRLPIGTVALTVYNRPVIKGEDEDNPMRWTPISGGEVRASDLARLFGPLTVVHIPEESK